MNSLIFILVVIGGGSSSHAPSGLIAFEKQEDCQATASYIMQNSRLKVLCAPAKGVRNI